MLRLGRRMVEDMLSLSLRRVGCAVGLSLAFVSSAFAVDRRVPQDFPTIQAAVDAAVNGDDIVVSPGNWAGFSVSGKTLKIRSTGSFATTRITSTSCTISNAPSGFEFENITLLGVSVSADSGVLTLDRVYTVNCGFSLSGSARAQVVDSELIGSSISADGSTNLTHTFTRSEFRSNSTVYGSHLSIIDCEFIACSNPVSAGGSVNISGSLFQGGSGSPAVQAPSVVATNSQFRDRQGIYRGAAIFSGGMASVTGCVFSECRLVSQTNSYQDQRGGAIYSEGALTVSNCQFTNCFVVTDWNNGQTTFSYGGALYCNAQNLAISDSSFAGCYTYAQAANSFAVSEGGAVYANTPTTVLRTTFTGCYAETRTYNSNIYGTGGAIRVAASSGSNPVGQLLTVTDCLLNNNSVFGSSNPFNSVPSPVKGLGSAIFCTNANITRSRFTANAASAGSIHLGSLGSNGQAFIRESYFSGNSATLANQGRDIATSAETFSVAFLSQNTFCALEAQACSGFYFEKGPNTFGADCADDCDGDGLPDQYELKIGLATDCNDNGIPDSCDFASGGGADCNNNNILDICEIAAGTGADCNGNGLLDACEPDCDGDGIPNSCEITAGAPDCDANGIPDSCQSDCNNDGVIDACAIAAGAADCNTNGIPDSCEIANGSVADFNKDAVPDTCQPSMQFAGLELEIVPIVNRGLDDLFPQTAICYRLYARTTVAGAAVVGLFGNNAHPLTLSAAGGFWQSPFGGDLASQIPCNLSGVLPSAKYDSWFTVGLTCSAGNAVQNTGLDLTAFNNNGGVNDNDGIIFVQPGSPQSIAGASKRVLLAQLTTNSAVLPTGFIDVVGRSASGTVGWEAYNQAIPVPALVDCNNNGQQDAFEIALGTVRDCDQSGVPDTCEYPSASTDCNGNGIPDLCDVVSAFSADLNGNFVPDECECSGDVDGNGRVDVDDIIDVISSWGATGDNPADVNNDNVVGAADLAIVLAGYGSCL
jgi:hypothetical protein